MYCELKVFPVLYHTLLCSLPLSHILIKSIKDQWSLILFFKWTLCLRKKKEHWKNRNILSQFKVNNFVMMMRFFSFFYPFIAKKKNNTRRHDCCFTFQLCANILNWVRHLKFNWGNRLKKCFSYILLLRRSFDRHRNKNGRRSILNFFLLTTNNFFRCSLP